MSGSTVNYIRREDIDIVKYDRCIEGSANPLIYAYSFYLDKMAKNWDVLVAGDYDLVMPLVWKKKYGIRYMYNQPFIQRLGIFGNMPFDETIIRSFEEKACRQFSYINAAVNFCPSPGIGIIRPRTNYLLFLNRPYEKIRDDYSKECKINIRKAQKRGCVFVTGIAMEKIMELYRTAYGHMSDYIKGTDYNNFRELVHILQQKEKIFSCGVIDGSTDELLFGALIFKSDGRLYYMMAAPSVKGRKARAGYFCIDQIIRYYSGTSQIFDFEGSDIPSVSDFYMRFSPQAEHYFQLTLNRLFWPLNLFK